MSEKVYNVIYFEMIKNKLLAPHTQKNTHTQTSVFAFD